jgi:L-iditol 2-dehydrogenase
MRAAVLHAIGDLRIEHVPGPSPGRGEVLVRVAACGVCGSDVPRILRDGTYRFPLIPGHEFAGVVAEVGPDATDWRPGDRVAVYPLLPCFACPSCRRGEYETCDDYGYLGSRQDGAFADYVVAPAWNLAQVPDGVSLLAAAVTEPAAVALHALRRCLTPRCGTVAVFGAGTIGLLVAQWARQLGAERVILADVQREKLAFAQDLGLGDLVDGSERPSAEQILERTDAIGVDLAIEAAGVPATVVDCLRLARKGGAVVLIGNPSAPVELPRELIWQILRKQLTIYGTWNSSFRREGDDWQTALQAMADGKLVVAPLVTHRYPLERLPEALQMMAEGREFHNKVMIVLDDELAGGTP